MDLRLSDKEYFGLAGIAGRLSARQQKLRRLIGRWTAIWLVSAVVMTALTGWLLYSAQQEHAAQREAEVAATAAQPPTETMAGNVGAANRTSVPAARAATPTTKVSASPASPASLDGLTLVRQSFRRGGLGSKALMTFTIRNTNDYPVKNIGLSCTFSSRDGSYVTERRHAIGATLAPHSRRTFRHLLVGFVSIGATRAKCALLSADWA